MGCCLRAVEADDETWHGERRVGNGRRETAEKRDELWGDCSSCHSHHFTGVTHSNKEINSPASAAATSASSTLRTRLSAEACSSVLKMESNVLLVPLHLPHFQQQLYICIPWKVRTVLREALNTQIKC